MSSDSHDPRDIPILTEVVEEKIDAPVWIDAKAVHAAILTETLQLADSLLHQAAREIEATLFEKVFDRLRANLPELIDRILHEHAAVEDSSKPHG